MRTPSVAMCPPQRVDITCYLNYLGLLSNYKLEVK
jgi:hypothetical protein